MNLDPDFIEAQQGHAEINFRIWSRSYNTIRYTLDALEAAEATIGTILNADPSNPRAIGLQIRIEVERLNRDQALTTARAAVFNQPDEPWLRNVLGLALLVSGEYEDAKAEFAAYEVLSPRLNSEDKKDLAWQYLRLGNANKALSLLISIPKEEAEVELQNRLMADAHALNGDIEIAKTYMAKFLKDTLWVNLMWQKPWFDIYSDTSIYEDYAAAITKAGLPEWPYNFDKGREGDRLLHNELVELFSDNYREAHTTGPFGAPYREVRKADGTISMHFAWMNGIPITGKWYIKEDQFCHRLPAIHMGREECNNVYIDREKSTESVKHIIVKHIINVYSIGLFKSEFRRVEE